MMTAEPFFMITKILSLLTEVLLGLFMLSKSLGPRRFRWRCFFLPLLFLFHTGLILWEEFVLAASFANSYYFYLLLHAIMFSLFSFLFCEGKPIFKLFLSLTFVSMITLCRFPADLLLSLLSALFHSYYIIRIGSNIAGSAALILVTCILIHYRPDVRSSYPYSYYLIMVVTPILNSASMTLLKNHFDAVSDVIHYVALFSLLTELLLYYMIWQSTTEYSQRIHLQLMQQQQTYHNQHMAELNTIVTEYRHLRHDFKNHIACMDRLMSQGKYPELKEYFYTFCKDIYSLDDQIETGNEIVNQVINIKYATDHQLQIPLDMKILVPQQLNIPDHLLCSLMVNLLDNALEASQKVEKPQIILEMKMVKKYLSFTVRNRIEEHQYESAVSRKTTKPSPNNHGLGLQIVQDIVTRYNGISAFETEDGWYLASVMLEL